MSRHWSPLLVLLCGAILWVACSKTSRTSQPLVPNEPEPVCGFSADSLNFGSVATGDSAVRTITLLNRGGGTLQGSVTLTSGDFHLYGPPTYSLGKGEPKAFALCFAPTHPGPQTASLRTTQTECNVAVTGTGVVPVCAQLSTATLDFGVVDIGTAVDRTFTLTNHNAGPLSGSVSTGGCADFQVAGTSSYTLAAGQAATFIIRYTPTSPGPANCTVQTGSGGCPTVACTATAQAQCSISPTALYFGVVAIGASKDTSFVLTNIGSHTLSGTLGAICSGGQFGIVGSTSYTLAPGQSRTVTVRCAPNIGAGSISCDITTGSSCGPVHCTAMADFPAVDGSCQVSTGSLAFGPVVVGQSSTKVFTIHNTHGGTTQISGSISVSGPGYSTQQTNYILDPGGWVNVPIVFAPPSLGSFAGKVDISQTGCQHCGASCGSVALSGSGTTVPACTLTPDSLDFGKVLPGQVKDLSFTIANTGGGSFSGTVTAPCYGYSITSAPTYTLSPGQSATIGVRFNPLSAGTGDRPCTLQTGSALCPTLPCTAFIDGPPICAVYPTYIDFGNVVVGQSRDTIVTVQNQGGGTLTGWMRSHAAFSVVGDSTFSLGSWESAAMHLRFTPTLGSPGLQGNLFSPSSLGCPSMQLWGTGVSGAVLPRPAWLRRAVR